MFEVENHSSTAGTSEKDVQVDKKAKTYDHRRSKLIEVKSQTLKNNKYQLLFYLKNQ